VLEEEGSDRAFAKVNDPALLLRHTAHADLIRTRSLGSVR
jgi:hypothetical protein